MLPIICDNSIKSVVDKIQEYVEKGSTIRGIRLVDQTEEQVVILVDDKPIGQDKADVWWEGFCSALGEI